MWGFASFLALKIVHCVFFLFFLRFGLIFDIIWRCHFGFWEIFQICIFSTLIDQTFNRFIVKILCRMIMIVGCSPAAGSKSWASQFSRCCCSALNRVHWNWVIMTLRSFDLHETHTHQTVHPLRLGTQPQLSHVHAISNLSDTSTAFRFSDMTVGTWQLYIFLFLGVFFLIWHLHFNTWTSRSIVKWSVHKVKIAAAVLLMCLAWKTMFSFLITRVEEIAGQETDVESVVFFSAIHRIYSS